MRAKHDGHRPGQPTQTFQCPTADISIEVQRRCTQLGKCICWHIFIGCFEFLKANNIRLPLANDLLKLIHSPAH
jgi:hypothetical protein